MTFLPVILSVINILQSTVLQVFDFEASFTARVLDADFLHSSHPYVRPIQWHLKNNWRVPESLEKVIQVPRSLQPHLQWWLKEDNVLTGQPLHPIKHTLQIFTDASIEGWGAHLNEHTAGGTGSLPGSKLHINYLELKTVFLALKEFQDLAQTR